MPTPLEAKDRRGQRLHRGRNCPPGAVKNYFMLIAKNVTIADNLLVPNGMGFVFEAPGFHDHSVTARRLDVVGPAGITAKAKDLGFGGPRAQFDRDAVGEQRRYDRGVAEGPPVV